MSDHYFVTEAISDMGSITMLMDEMNPADYDDGENGETVAQQAMEAWEDAKEGFEELHRALRKLNRVG